MPKVCLSNFASQYGIHLSALAPNLDPSLHVVDAWKETALRSSREGSGGAAKAMPGAYDLSEKRSQDLVTLNLPLTRRKFIWPDPLYNLPSL